MVEVVEKVDDFIRERFGVDGHLEVVGWDGERRRGAKLYTVKCSVCAKDPELYGVALFKSRTEHLRSGKVPCGCSRAPKWTEEQNIIRVKRYCATINCEFLGFVGEYTGQHTHLRMKCLEDGHEWTTTSLNSLLNMLTGCPSVQSLVLTPLNLHMFTS